MQYFENYRLGIDDEEVEIASSDEHRHAATKIALQCRRDISIISRELDPTVYDMMEFVEAVKSTVLANRRTRVRIMVFESQLIARRGHMLLHLAASLPSYIEFRKPGREYDSFNESLFVGDSTAYVFRNNAERFEGKVNFSDKRKSKTFMNIFEEMWARSNSDPNLRALSL